MYFWSADGQLVLPMRTQVYTFDEPVEVGGGIKGSSEREMQQVGDHHNYQCLHMSINAANAETMTDLASPHTASFQLLSDEAPQQYVHLAGSG